MVFVLIALLFTSPALAHENWISEGGFKNQAGEWCCGAYDCHELGYSPRVITGGYLLENDEAVRNSEVMPISPEGWVVCRRPDGSRRCVFSPPSSY